MFLEIQTSIFIKCRFFSAVSNWNSIPVFVIIRSNLIWMIDLDQIVEDFSERQEIKTVCQITISEKNGDFRSFY